MTRQVLDAALRAVALARAVEQASEGHGEPGERQARRNRLGKFTDDRIIEAVHAGASTKDIALALGVGIGRAQERARDARKAAGEWEPQDAKQRQPRRRSKVEPDPDDLVVSLRPPGTSRPEEGAPNVWLDVPRCSVVLPPPAPASATCHLDRGHPGEHRVRGPRRQHPK